MTHLVKNQVSKNVTVECAADNEVLKVVERSERGFSIIELVIVCVVIGIIATIAIPYLQRAVTGSENGNMYATLHSMATTESAFYSQRSRYARLNEVNNLMAGSVGTQSGNDLIRGRFVIRMTPAAPTDGELQNSYIITATRTIDGITYLYKVSESGIDPIFP